MANPAYLLIVFAILVGLLVVAFPGDKKIAMGDKGVGPSKKSPAAKGSY